MLLAFNWLYWPKLIGKQRMLFGKGNTKLIAGKSGCDWHLADSTLCLQPLQQISRKWIHCGSRGYASCQYLVACLVFEQNRKSGSQTLTWSTMDFRPREALFFGENFFKLITIGFTFSHHPFQPKRRYPSIWSLNKISKFRVPVIDP